jgi:HSP20 family protein
MLMRFDPFDRLTRDFWGLPSRPFVPVDAYRAGDRFYLHFDLPGVDPDSIEVTVEKNTLTVKADRNWSVPKDGTLLITERPQGSFTRQFFLGEGLDSDRIEAGYDHGVLTVTVPVAEQAKPRRITVGSADKALAG